MAGSNDWKQVVPGWKQRNVPGWQPRADWAGKNPDPNAVMNQAPTENIISMGSGYGGLADTLFQSIFGQAMAGLGARGIGASSGAVHAAVGASAEAQLASWRVRQQNWQLELQEAQERRMLEGQRMGYTQWQSEFERQEFYQQASLAMQTASGPMPPQAQMRGAFSPSTGSYEGGEGVPLPADNPLVTRPQPTGGFYTPGEVPPGVGGPADRFAYQEYIRKHPESNLTYESWLYYRDELGL